MLAFYCYPWTYHIYLYDITLSQLLTDGQKKLMNPDFIKIWENWICKAAVIDLYVLRDFFVSFNWTVLCLETKAESSSMKLALWMQAYDKLNQKLPYQHVYTMYHLEINGQRFFLHEYLLVSITIMTKFQFYIISNNFLALSY